MDQDDVPAPSSEVPTVAPEVQPRWMRVSLIVIAIVSLIITILVIRG